MTPSQPTIIFFNVRDNASKVNLICSTIQKHFEEKKRVLLLAPNAAAAEYLDKLLWRLPEESFLPHAISSTHTEEPIVITTETTNWNQATVLFNLCPLACALTAHVEIIYELMDETQSDKKQLAQARKQIYQSQGMAIEERA